MWKHAEGCACVRFAKMCKERHPPTHASPPHWHAEIHIRAHMHAATRARTHQGWAQVCKGDLQAPRGRHEGQQFVRVRGDVKVLAVEGALHREDWDFGVRQDHTDKRTCMEEAGPAMGWH